MESISTLKRRTTDLMSNVHQNLPQMPSLSPPTTTATRKQASEMNGSWERIDIPSLPRSSHSLDTVHGNVYIFGGEINPRQPVDNDMHVLTMPCNNAGADYFRIKARPAHRDGDLTSQYHRPTNAANDPASQQRDLDEVPLEGSSSNPTRQDKGKGKEPATDSSPELGQVPQSRVGHATAVIGSRIFLFGGRGGPDMAPLDEGGRVWVFDTRWQTWSYLDPVPAVQGGTIVPHPAARSYHCATATDRPREFLYDQQKQRLPPRKNQTWQQWALGDISKTGIPQDPVVGRVAEDAVDQEDAGYGTFFVHAGCVASGERTSDLWAFDVRARTWTELPAAPAPARGGSAICISKSRLFRFGGYDGEGEVGGQLDFLHLEVEEFNDRSARGEVSLHARGSWQTILANNIDASSTEIPAEPIQSWPAARSVASFHAMTIGSGREYLVLAMGEGEPSSAGHEGAGKFHSDVWTFQVPPLGMTPASFTDAFLGAVGRKTGEGRWIRVETAPYDADESDEEPLPRGWMASAPMTDVEESGIVMLGGLGEDNRRLGDAWILRLK